MEYMVKVSQKNGKLKIGKIFYWKKVRGGEELTSLRGKSLKQFLQAMEITATRGLTR